MWVFRVARAGPVRLRTLPSSASVARSASIAPAVTSGIRPVAGPSSTARPGRGPDHAASSSLRTRERALAVGRVSADLRLQLRADLLQIDPCRRHPVRIRAEPCRLGAVYAATTMASAAVMVFACGLTDRYRVRWIGLTVLFGLAVATLLMSLPTALWSLLLAVFLLRLMGQGMMAHAAMVARPGTMR